MHKKNIFNYYLLASLSVMPALSVQAMDHKDIAYIAAGVSTVTALGCAIWAYTERSNRNKLQVDLDGRNLLSNAGEHGKHVNHEYGRFFTLFKDSNFLTAEKLKLYIEFMQPYLSSREALHEFDAKLARDLQKTVQFQQQLKVLSLSLNQIKSREGEASLIEKVLQPLIELVHKKLEALRMVSQQQNNLLQVKVVLTQYEHKYNNELGCLESAEYLTDKNSEKLHEHIKAHYSKAPYQFPYITYVESVKKDMVTLQELHARLSSENNSFARDTVTRSGYFIELFDKILRYISSYPLYTQEKQHKPEFDRQEERLKIELQERQARVERERQATEARLQHERNRAQELANAARDVELKIKELARQKEAATLEEARIKDGVTVQEAVAKKEKELQAKYNGLVQERLQLAQNIKDLNAQNRKLSQSIATANHAILALQSKLRNLPYNPNAVEWLPGYLQELKNQAQRLAQCLQIEGHQDAASAYQGEAQPGEQVEGRTGEPA